MFRKTQVPILGVVENMSMFICPDCGSCPCTSSAMAARARRRERLGAPFLGEIPLVPRIRETSDAGTPVSVSVPDGPEAKAFLALAEKSRGLAGDRFDRPAPKIVIE